MRRWSSPRLFTLETATQKVRLAEDAWNSAATRTGSALAYTEDSVWRNRGEFVTGRDRDPGLPRGQVGARARLPAGEGPVGVHRQPHRRSLPVRVGADAAGRWFRSYGNELWEFDERGLMRRREASINDVAILDTERKFFWPAPGPRPADHPGIPDVKYQLAPDSRLPAINAQTPTDQGDPR